MSPSSLVQWTHNLPHLDQTFGEVNSSFQIPSATLEDSYSESLITLPVIIAGLSSIPVLFFCSLLMCRGLLKYVPNDMSKSRDYVILTTVAGALALLLLHLLFLGDVTFLNNGITGVQDNLAVLQKAFNLILSKSNSATIDSYSILNTLNSETNLNSACIRSVNNMKSLTMSLQSNLYTFGNASTKLTARIAEFDDVIDKVGYYRQAFLFSVYGIGMFLLISSAAGYFLKWKSIVRAAVASSLLFVFACISLATILLSTAMTTADFCMDSSGNFANVLSSNPALSFYSSCNGVNPLRTYSLQAQATNAILTSNITFSTRTGGECAGSISTQTLLGLTASIDSITQSSNLYNCSYTMDVWNPLLNTYVCGTGFTGLFFQVTVLYLIALFFFALSIGAGIVFPYFDLQKEEEETMKVRLSGKSGPVYVPPPSPPDGLEGGQSNRDRNRSVRSLDGRNVLDVGGDAFTGRSRSNSKAQDLQNWETRSNGSGSQEGGWRRPPPHAAPSPRNGSRPSSRPNSRPPSRPPSPPLNPKSRSNSISHNGHGDSSPRYPEQYGQEYASASSSRTNSMRVDNYANLVRPSNVEYVDLTRNNLVKSTSRPDLAIPEDFSRPSTARDSPRDYAPSPREYAPSPREYAPSPREYAPSPREYVPSPRGSGGSGRDYAAPPQDHRADPRIDPRDPRADEFIRSSSLRSDGPPRDYRDEPSRVAQTGTPRDFRQLTQPPRHTFDPREEQVRSSSLRSDGDGHTRDYRDELPPTPRSKDIRQLTQPPRRSSAQNDYREGYKSPQQQLLQPPQQRRSSANAQFQEAPPPNPDFIEWQEELRRRNSRRESAPQSSPVAYVDDWSQQENRRGPEQVEQIRRPSNSQQLQQQQQQQQQQQEWQNSNYSMQHSNFSMEEWQPRSRGNSVRSDMRRDDYADQRMGPADPNSFRSPDGRPPSRETSNPGSRSNSRPVSINLSKPIRNDAGSELDSRYWQQQGQLSDRQGYQQPPQQFPPQMYYSDDQDEWVGGVPGMSVRQSSDQSLDSFSSRSVAQVDERGYSKQHPNQLRDRGASMDSKRAIEPIIEEADDGRPSLAKLDALPANPRLRASFLEKAENERRPSSSTVSSTNTTNATRLTDIGVNNDVSPPRPTTSSGGISLGSAAALSQSPAMPSQRIQRVTPQATKSSPSVNGDAKSPRELFGADEVNAVLQYQLAEIFRLYGTALFSPPVTEAKVYNLAEVTSLLHKQLERHSSMMRAAGGTTKPPSTRAMLEYLQDMEEK